MKKTLVLSLGGSQIIPNEINTEFLENFKKIIIKNSKKYKFIIVCGGGSTARKYIKGLENQKNKEYFQSLVGISITRLNARFMDYFFNKDPKKGIPHSIKEIMFQLKKRNIIFCGALKYAKNQTSDTTSAEIAKHLKCEFINLTNVKGLYNKNPKKYKKAEFISEITYKKFLKIAESIKFKPGQHFVLDQKAAKIIKKYDIKTYIIGSSKELDNLLNNKHFVGTTITK